MVMFVAISPVGTTNSTRQLPATSACANASAETISVISTDSMVRGPASLLPTDQVRAFKDALECPVAELGPHGGKGWAQGAGEPADDQPRFDGIDRAVHIRELIKAPMERFRLVLRHAGVVHKHRCQILRVGRRPSTGNGTAPRCQAVALEITR